MVPHESSFDETLFLLKCMLSDSVFYADVEYHIYFIQKSSWHSKNFEIRVQFFYFLPPILKKIDFLNNRAELIQIDTYFCSLSIDDSNGIWKLANGFQTKELIGLRKQGVPASLAYTSRSCCKKKLWRNAPKAMWTYSLFDAESE